VWRDGLKESHVTLPALLEVVIEFAVLSGCASMILGRRAAIATAPYFAGRARATLTDAIAVDTSAFENATG